MTRWAITEFEPQLECEPVMSSKNHDVLSRRLGDILFRLNNGEALDPAELAHHPARFDRAFWLFADAQRKWPLSPRAKLSRQTRF